jgi:hypothetical protein
MSDRRKNNDFHQGITPQRRAADKHVKTQFFDEKLLGACSECSCYDPHRAHEFQNGILKIHCSLLSKMVHARTDIDHAKDCIPVVA